MKIAVVDDDAQARQTLGYYLEDAEHTPVRIEGSFASIKDLLKEILDKAEGAVCDHRLQIGGLGNFYGAEVAAALYDLNVPAVLVTQFLDIDADVSIRKYRSKLPAVVSRDNACGEVLGELLNKSIKEIGHEVAPDRRKRKAILRVEDISKEGEEDVVDATIETWNPGRAVRFPKAIMGQLASSVQVGMYFTALVNTGAAASDELFLEEFKIAPEPDPNDGL